MTASTSHIESRAEQGVCCFHRLCVGAGHGLLFSYYEALLNAVEQGDDAKLVKLYEAGLTATIRLRLTTSFAQLLADAHLWSESVRVSFCSASCDLLATVRMISAIPNLMSRATSVEKFRGGGADEAGISVQGPASQQGKCDGFTITLGVGPRRCVHEGVAALA